MTTIATNENPTDHDRASTAQETPALTTAASAGDEHEPDQLNSGANETPQRAAAAAAGDDGPDPDMPFFQPQQADRIPPPHIDFSTDPATLSPEDTLDRAHLMLERIFVSPAVRLEYYNRSRSWHKKSAGTGSDGGDFERQWLRMLATELPGGKGQGLNMNDFGNIHQVMFLTLRRAMLAVTGHDVHPNPFATTPATGTTVRSFHFIPNDTSNPAGTYNPTSDLGFALDQP